MFKSILTACAVALVCWGCGMQTPSVEMDGINVPVTDNDGDGAVVETADQICLKARQMGADQIVCYAQIAAMEDRAYIGAATHALRTGDCNDQDATVRPGAQEVANGKDDNCDGQLAMGECLNGTPMSDGDACNGLETCMGGSVSAGTPLNCADTNGCTVDSCNPATGCVNAVLADGAACDDGNSCTQVDTCQIGVCTGNSPVVCAASDQCHAIGVCDTVTGLCTNPVQVNGTACDDGSACTTNDVCQAGACTGGPALICDDSNPCTTDSCAAATGCGHINVANGTQVLDADLCNGTETCQNGAVTPGTNLNCNDNNPCTDDACTAAAGCGHVNNTLPCSDGTACTNQDTCTNGSCVGTALNCNDNVSCTTDTCDAGLGCQHAPVADGTACSDGTACTANETCQAGACVGNFVGVGNCVSCNNDTECAASRPGTLPAEFLWGCTENNGPPSGYCTSCADSDADGICAGNEYDCGNQLDENGNGLVDCADPQCNTAPGCAAACQNDTDCNSGQVCFNNTCRTPVSVCDSFTVELPAGTTVTKLWFWPLTGPGYLQEINVTGAGGQFVAPPESCSATIDYDRRWNTVEAKTFPVGPPAAPQGNAILANGTRVQACVLTYETGAWGWTHDGLSCATSRPAGW